MRASTIFIDRIIVLSRSTMDIEVTKETKSNSKKTKRYNAMQHMLRTILIHICTLNVYVHTITFKFYIIYTSRNNVHMCHNLS